MFVMLLFPLISDIFKQFAFLNFARVFYHLVFDVFYCFFLCWFGAVKIYSAKENLFNVLNNYIDFEEGVTALDLFAGTGSISIELVSRGCDRVISVEKEPAHHSFICKIMKEVQTDKCLPIRGDVFKFIKNGREQFDFIFADPPYALKELETIPELIFQNNLLKEGGLLVLEHGKDNNFEENPHFIERRVYGSVNFSLFR